MRSAMEATRRVERARGKCGVCARHLERPGVICGDCGAPYHPDCYAYQGRCARFGCIQAHGKARRSLPGSPVLALWRPTPLPRLLANWGRKALVCLVVVLPVATALSGFLGRPDAGSLSIALPLAALTCTLGALAQQVYRRRDGRGPGRTAGLQTALAGLLLLPLCHYAGALLDVPADVARMEGRCAPVIRAIDGYRARTGHYPESLQALEIQPQLPHEPLQSAIGIEYGRRTSADPSAESYRITATLGLGTYRSAYESESNRWRHFLN